MNADDNDKLWKLLGNARQPDVSPFFSRNVLRTIRQEEASRRAITPLGDFRKALVSVARGFQRWYWKFAIAGTCTVIAVLSISPGAFRHHPVADTQAGVTRQIVANPDYEVINHLDELVADEESSLWLDDSAH
jgi:hypothetical protein